MTAQWAPIITAKRKRDRLVVDCPFCHGRHHHDVAKPMPQREPFNEHWITRHGTRLSHCTSNPRRYQLIETAPRELPHRMMIGGAWFNTRTWYPIAESEAAQDTGADSR